MALSSQPTCTASQSDTLNGRFNIVDQRLDNAVYRLYEIHEKLYGPFVTDTPQSACPPTPADRNTADLAISLTTGVARLEELINRIRDRLA